MVVFALAVLWMVVLTPMILRRCDEASPAGPVRAFRMQLGALRHRGCATIPAAHRMSGSDFRLLDIPPLVPALQPLRPSYSHGGNSRVASAPPGSPLLAGALQETGTATALLERPQVSGIDLDGRQAEGDPSTMLPPVADGASGIVLDEIRAAAAGSAARSAARRARAARKRKRKRQMAVTRRLVAGLVALTLGGAVPGMHVLLVGALLDAAMLVGYSLLLRRHLHRS